MLAGALTLVLAAAPLDVRVLERLSPTHVTLTAKKLTCDGKPLTVPMPATLDVGVREVKVGTALCEVLDASGDLSVKVGDTTRRYPGSLTVNLEASYLRFINHVDLEDYLPAVVAAEAGDAPPAALEAQAIVSRTFTLASRQRHHREGYELCDMAHCQVYPGIGKVTKAARAAVLKTKDQVLLVGGVVLKPAYFHSACGGYTSTAESVFHDEGVGMSVKDEIDGAPACKGAPDFTWEWKVERDALAKGLGLKPEGSAFEPLGRDAGGRVLEVRSFGKRFTGTGFQSAVGKAFGWTALRSMKVTAEQVENVVRFKGAGFGHGVGLCQYGAKARAEKGESAASILKHYFPDARIGDASSLPAH